MSYLDGGDALTGSTLAWPASDGERERGRGRDVKIKAALMLPLHAVELELLVIELLFPLRRCLVVVELELLIFELHPLELQVTGVTLPEPQR